MTELQSKCVLITGVAGLLGSNLADWIIENCSGYNVIGIDNLFGGYIENVNSDVVFYKRDLVTDSIDDIFRENDIEYVYHMAAYAAEGLSPFIRMFNYKQNCVATANVINCCIKYGVKRLVFTSSMAVYGHGSMTQTRFDEDDQPVPIDPYGIAKYACEMDIRVAGEQHELDWCIIRPHNIFGKKQNIWDKYRNVLGIWMYQILQKQPMLIYGDGEQTRAFTYVGDIMRPLWNAAILDEASKQIINLGGTQEYTINKAAEILCNITGYDNIEHKEPRHEVKWAVPTYQKSIDILGYENEHTLEDGLYRSWEWAKKQPNRPLQKWNLYELEKGIYTYWNGIYNNKRIE